MLRKGLRKALQKAPAQFPQPPLSTTVPVVFSDYSSGKIMSLHCCCITPYPSWVLSLLLCNCFEENCVTAQRVSPLLEPGSGNIENGNLPSLVLRSDTLPKLFSFICQHFVLSSSISFSPNFPGPTSLHGAANTTHSSSKVSPEPPLRLGTGTSGLSTESLALGFQQPWFLSPASKTDSDYNWCCCLLIKLALVLVLRPPLKTATDVV